ncbi:MAG: tripartite tricarboxylate transporter substrate binding protein [Burkholderiales bacterium]
MKVDELIVACISLLAAFTLQAADWPSRPIVVLDGFAPGGGTDVFMRVMAVEMTKTFGQPVVVENRSGASGHIAAEAVARAAPDGYLIMIHTASMITSRPLYAKLGYDVIRDLTPVTQLVRIPNVLVVPPALPVKNVREFLALAKRRPGEFVFASTGLGSISHVVGELFQQVVGIRSIHVPYRGAAPATTALISGEATYGFIVPPVIRSHVEAGKLRALAVSTIKRTAVFPEVPTLDEAGVKGIDIPHWYGIWAPAKTPPAIIDALYREYVRVMALPAIRQRFQREGAETVGSTPAEFAAFVQSEVARWTEVARKAGLKPES